MIFKRTSSDTLAKLCVRYGQRVLKAISEGRVGVRSDSLKVRLITYYINLGPAWSRDREKKDWDGHDLASLKYDTFRLLIRVLAQEGEWINQDLHAEIAEIAWAIQHQAFSAAIDICDASSRLAFEREELGFLLQILEFEKDIIDSLPESSESMALLSRYRSRKKAFMDLQHEVSACADLRHFHLEPIKSIWEKDEIIPIGLAESLRAAFERIDEGSLRSATAKIDFYSSGVLSSLLNGRADKATEYFRLLIKTYNGSPWFSSKYETRKISHFRTACIHFMQVDLWEEVEPLLEFLDSFEVNDSKQSVLAAYSWIVCMLRWGVMTKDAAFLSKAMGKIRQQGTTFEVELEELEWITINWLLMINLLQGNDWRGALEVGKKLIERKSKLKKNILVNVRIALFACEVVLFAKDDQRIESSFDATSKFLARNKENFPDALKVLRCIFNIWSTVSFNLENRKSQRRSKEPLTSTPMFATYSGNIGYFDFAPIMENLREKLTNHQ